MMVRYSISSGANGVFSDLTLMYQTDSMEVAHDKVKIDLLAVHFFLKWRDPEDADPQFQKSSNSSRRFPGLTASGYKSELREKQKLAFCVRTG
jgi:hypothetical protein